MGVFEVVEHESASRFCTTAVRPRSKIWPEKSEKRSKMGLNRLQIRIHHKNLPIFHKSSGQFQGKFLTLFFKLEIIF